MNPILKKENIMQPNPTLLLEKLGLKTPLIGFYDAPETSAFDPIIKPKPLARICVFAYYKLWLKGKTLLITKENFGCGGAGHWLCDVTTRSREDYVKFLADDEGLKASHDLMNQWLDHHKPYQQTHPNILLGPLNKNQYEYLKTITFLVNPDQVGLLMLAAQYFNAPGEPAPVIAPFGSGCMQLASVFENLHIPQAAIGATDIAMRKYIPSDLLAFTVTKLMYENFCKLDERSFLTKPFWQGLQKARGMN